jgi:iron transport multicopper oxidase
MVNIGAFAGQRVWFEGHTMKIVEVDGIYTDPFEADMIYLTAAQRYSFLITAKNDTKANYAFVGSMDTVRRTPCSSYMHADRPRIYSTLSLIP